MKFLPRAHGTDSCYCRFFVAIIVCVYDCFVVIVLVVVSAGEKEEKKKSKMNVRGKI